MKYLALILLTLIGCGGSAEARPLKKEIVVKVAVIGGSICDVAGPFCGKPATLWPPQNPGEEWCVECITCDIGIVRSTNQEAIDAWNHRDGGKKMMRTKSCSEGGTDCLYRRNRYVIERN